MALKEELGLKHGFTDMTHEALLNIYYTASMMKKRADVFFSQFGLTDVQYNLMGLLYYESGSTSSPHDNKENGLSQAQISDMMLVNRANITSLIDRMEKAELVIRTDHSSDRRFNIIKLTAKGEKLYKKVEPAYMKQVHKAVSSLNESEIKKLMATLEKVRATLRT